MSDVRENIRRIAEAGVTVEEFADIARALARVGMHNLAGIEPTQEPTPEPKPGTAGTATVAGVEGTRVMRIALDPSALIPSVWVTSMGHHATDSVVTDFEPDAPSACAADGVSTCPKMAYSNKQIERERDDWQTRAELSEAAVAWMKPEVERLRAQLASLGEGRNALALRLDRLSVDSVREAIRTALRDELYSPLPEEISDEVVSRVLRIVADDESDAAPEPRPAFVLPERSEVFELLETAYRDEVGPVSSYSPFLVRATTDVLALLAEHAVTEDSLTTALMPTYFDQENSARTVARVTLANLTRKAAS